MGSTLGFLDFDSVNRFLNEYGFILVADCGYVSEECGAGVRAKIQKVEVVKGLLGFLEFGGRGFQRRGPYGRVVVLRR